MQTVSPPAVADLKITGAYTEEFAEILSHEALEFLVALEKNFGQRRKALLARRKEIQARLDAGEKPGFLPETEAIRTGDWKVAPLPNDLQDRRVEITGPVDRKMVINALNSGAKMFMADFEDSNAPVWENCVRGQINLRDAQRRTITYTNPGNGKFYQLNDQTATLLVRARGWHLEEKHVLVNGQPMSASLFDFGLYFFHNAAYTLANGTGPYFYLPKLENHLEARLWNDVFVFAQDHLSIPQGSIKATVLIENILASFEMHEILYELREHSAGLNCGRWDYIFSAIKKFKADPTWVLPDRANVTMTTEFMRAYSLLVIQTCHQRGVHAMGGMAAQIPIKNDPAANEAALAKVAADKEREAKDGHDGTWVAHPGLVPIAMEVFDRYMPGPNQLDKMPTEEVSAQDLISPPSGPVTRQGFELNIDVSVQYLAAWLDGLGCVPIYNLMEDAATAEISRAQLWQWLHNTGVQLEDGTPVNQALFDESLPKVLDHIKGLVGEEAFTRGQYRIAAEMLADMVKKDDFEDFLTLPAYERLA